MKKFLLILIIIFTFACSNKDSNQNVITLTIKNDPFNRKPIGNAVNVTLKNNSNTNSIIWLMKCNYSKNFTVNNINIILADPECYDNIPKRVSLQPLEEKSITLYPIYPVGLSEQSFKIGFFHINDINKHFSTVEEYQKEIENSGSAKIIWSNELTL